MLIQSTMPTPLPGNHHLMSEYKALQNVLLADGYPRIKYDGDAPESPSASPLPELPYNAYGKPKRNAHSRQ